MSKGQGCKVFVGGLVRFCPMRLHECNPAWLAVVLEDVPSCHVGENICFKTVWYACIRPSYRGIGSSARLVIRIQSPLAVSLLPGVVIGCPRCLQYTKAFI